MSDVYESDRHDLPDLHEPHERHELHEVGGPHDGMADLPNDGGDDDDGDDDDDGLFPPPVTAAPQTGDPVIDEALVGLEVSARSGDLDAQVEAGEHVHRQLQERLDDLGGA